MARTLRGTALRLAVSSARRIPSSVRFPLQRDGVDPVPRLEASRERGDVVRLARLLGTRVWLVTGYDVARAVLADSDSFANDVRH
ncbi:MAG: cytochrome P450, partial [Nocardioides sp.]